MRSLAQVVSALLTVVAAGCSVASSPSSSSDTVAGANGHVEVEVQSVGAVREGPNGFRLQLVDAATNAPLLGAQLTARVSMPAMGHESGEADATEIGGGTYELPSVVFDMPGAWSLRLRVQKDALVDEAEYPVEVP